MSGKIKITKNKGRADEKVIHEGKDEVVVRCWDFGNNESDDMSYLEAEIRDDEIHIRGMVTIPYQPPALDFIWPDTS